jgi:hypothetical protein
MLKHSFVCFSRIALTSLSQTAERRHRSDICRKAKIED